jgi:hypothetical protein
MDNYETEVAIVRGLFTSELQGRKRIANAVFNDVEYR